MHIYLLRHGHTPQTGTYTGSTDVELSAAGREQITSLASFLQAIDFDHCFCSPLARCRQTLSLLALRSEISFAESLREVDFGSWEGLSFEQIENAYPDELNDWINRGEAFKFPGGEKINDFNSRVITWFNNLLTKQFNRVLIVAHGGVIRVGLCHLLGIDMTRAFAFNPKQGRVALVYVEEGSGRLDLFNCGGA